MFNSFGEREGNLEDCYDIIATPICFGEFEATLFEVGLVGDPSTPQIIASANRNFKRAIARMDGPLALVNGVVTGQSAMILGRFLAPFDAVGLYDVRKKRYLINAANPGSPWQINDVILVGEDGVLVAKK